MSSITSKILAHTKSLPEGVTVSAQELLHFGSRTAIDQALSRLTRKGKLFRIATGMYAYPTYSRFGVAPPNVGLVIRNIVEKTGEVIAPNGAVSANRLRLTTMNPKRLVLLTSGKSRNLTFKKSVVKLRNAPSWQLLEPNSVPGHAIRAIDFMGKYQAEWVIEKLNELLKPDERKTLLALRPNVPQWIATGVSLLAK